MLSFRFLIGLIGFLSCMFHLDLLPAGTNEQLSQENQELKQNKEELEVRMNALKSQYEGRLLRLDRELRELRETQAHSDGREEAQDQSGAKVHYRLPRVISNQNVPKVVKI